MRRRRPAKSSTPHDLVWVVVGDRSALEKDLRGLDLAPIEIWDVNGRPVG